MALPRAFLRSPGTEALLARALREDLGAGDLTTRLCVPATARAHAQLQAREAGVAAGLELFARVFRRLDPKVRVKLKLSDGRPFKAGAVLAELDGPARALLSGERVALNLLQRLCGIATLSRNYVAAARTRSASVQVQDTRKTTPGLRLLEKYAVACGGGTNHRLALDDAILIKDNHVKAAGSVGTAVRLARRSKRPVEVEVEDLAELAQALDAGADVVLLDNMAPPALRRAVALVAAHRARTGKRVLTEASGGITLKGIAAVAATGVDRISVGALTHSPRALDLSLEFVPR